MLRKLRQRAREEEEGFTLIELLVVILIIGILAAIALPTFLGQQQKGQDAAAKSSARNAVSQMESCYSDTQSYTTCAVSGTFANTGLTWGTGPGQVQVTSSGATSYVVTAYSASSVNYTITKTASATPVRDCTSHGTGACKAAADAQGNYW